jgi:hypothetical protein
MFTFTAFSQEEGAVDEVDLSSFQDVEKRYQYYNRQEDPVIKNQKFKNLDVDRFSIENIRKSPVYRAQINKGTFVYDLNKKEVFQIPRHIYVYAHKRMDAGKRRYIINKKGVISHMILAKDLHNVDSFIGEMYEGPSTYTPFEKVKIKKQFDEKGQWSVGGALYTGLYKPTFTKDLGDETVNILGTTFKGEVNTLFKFRPEYQLGVSVQLENYTMDLSAGDDISSTNWSIGPIFKSGVIKLFASDIHFMAQYRWSMVGSITDKRDGLAAKYNYSSNQLQLGVLSVDQEATIGGLYNWGLHFQRQWVRGAALTYTLETNPSNNFDDAIFVSFHYNKGIPWLF